MKYQLLNELIQHLEKFESIQGQNHKDINAFAQWLANETKPSSSNAAIEPLKSSEPIYRQPVNALISILIGRMGKYARVYSKKILSNTILSGMDDYSFMATLMFHEQMTKSELIHYNLLDSVTSGADIIKRLLSNELIKEEENPNDKRSKSVSITPKGQKLMVEVFKEMHLASEIVTGNLNNNEKHTLVELLSKLDAFHKDIFENDRKLALSAIKNKHLGE
ncbi:MAG: MarR family winged helix-turn-helix transcriptional regulator [Salinivirgaceae bacterium]